LFLDDSEQLWDDDNTPSMNISASKIAKPQPTAWNFVNSWERGDVFYLCYRKNDCKQYNETISPKNHNKFAEVKKGDFEPVATKGTVFQRKTRERRSFHCFFGSYKNQKSRRAVSR